MTDIDKMLIPDNVTGKGEDRRMKRFGRAALAVALASSMAVTPVFAAPDTDELESSKAAAQSEADSLQEQLTELLNKAGELEEEMITTGEKIIEAQADLEEAQQKADEQYASMKVRIQYMYENGQATAIETLLSATDFSDFVNKAEYISNVHTYDRQQLQALEDTEKEIQDLKTTLEEEQKKQESMQEEYEAQEAELNATLEEKKRSLTMTSRYRLRPRLLLRRRRRGRRKARVQSHREAAHQTGPAAETAAPAEAAHPGQFPGEAPPVAVDHLPAVHPAGTPLPPRRS